MESRLNIRGMCQICKRRHINANNRTPDICSYCKITRKKEVEEYLEKQND